MLQQAIQQITDPAVAEDEAAAGILALGERFPIPSRMAEAIAAKADLQRAARIAAIMRDTDPAAPSTTAMAVQVAELSGDHNEVIALTDPVWQRLPKDLLLSRADALVACARPADAFDSLQAAAMLDPTDTPVHAMLSQTVISIFQQLGATARDAACPCGSTLAYGECCRKIDTAAMERFGDRGALDAFRVRVDRFSMTPPVRQQMLERLDDWTAADGSRPTGEEARAAVERAWMVAHDSPSILQSYIERPDTSDEDARRADDWQSCAMYGLWRRAGDDAGPGHPLVDYLTGARLYVASADGQLDGTGPDHVFAGLILPFDGIWRTGAVLFGMDEDYAKRMATMVRAMVADIAAKTGVRGLVRRLSQPMPWPPPEAMDGIGAMLLSRTLATMFPMLLSVNAAPRAPIVVHNTDGDPLEMISAEIAVADTPALAAAFDDHPDFHYDGRDGVYVWEGRELTPDEVRQSADLAREQGLDVEEPDEPQRWIRGRVELRAHHAVVDVNSRERLDAFVTLLSDLGASPAIVSERVTDLPPGVTARPRDAAAAIRSKFSREPLRPVPLPSEDALRAAAADSPMRRYVATLLEMLGDKGVKLTGTGQLPIATGRALAEATGIAFDTVIGDRTFKSRSSGEVREIALTVAWARAAGLIKVEHGRASRTKRAAGFGPDPLADWWLLFEAFVRKLNWPVRRWQDDRRAWWCEDMARAVPLILTEAARTGVLDADAIGATIREGLSKLYRMDGQYLDVTLAADVAYGIAQPLVTLGALTAIEEPYHHASDMMSLKGGRMTPLGHWAVRKSALRV